MRKGDLRKQAILDTAETLFFEKGYNAATIQDILDELDCSKGSFYHHYESKLQVLMGLCMRRAEKSFDEYKEQCYDTPLERLNGLFYYAMPFREGEDRNLALLLPLEGLADGSVVRQAVIDAQKEFFFPELCGVLELLKASGTVHYTHTLLPELIWDAYTVCYARMMKMAADIMNDASPRCVVELIEAERFIWERLLDAPYGTVELIRADEALQTISHAVSRLRRQQQEQKNAEGRFANGSV